MEKRFGVISADGHCRLMHLPFDLWTRRLPQRLQDDAPRVVTGADGKRQWVVEGHAWSGVGWAGTGRGAVNCYTRHGIPEEAEPGIFRAASAKYRCEDMDRDGVDVELVNGPYEQISQIKNPELRAACVRAINDWSRELYEESDGRFIMLLPLPSQTPEEAAAELYRVAEFGMPTGIIFDWVGAPEPVLHQQWEKVWAAASETGLPVNLHANPSGGSRQLGVGVQGLEPRNQFLMRVANFPMGAMAELASAVVLSGICDRHPGIRFVIEEAGVGWVPFLYWRLDREYEFGDPGNRVFKPDIPLQRMPTEILKRHVYFTFEVEEEGGFRRVPEIGYDNFLWASDFPGLDSPWPDSKAKGHAPVAAALGQDGLDRLVFESARKLYNIPVREPARAAAE
jgi:predicted TIM-barrel fold metal-dependent hydrolase